MREWFKYRLEQLELLKLDSNAGLELVWKVVEGPLLLETPVPIPGRGKVDKDP